MGACRSRHRLPRPSSRAPDGVRRRVRPGRGRARRDAVDVADLRAARWASRWTSRGPVRPQSRATTWASVSGVHDRPAAIHHAGAQRGIQLALTTAGRVPCSGCRRASWRGSCSSWPTSTRRWRDLPEPAGRGARRRSGSTVVWRALGDAVVAARRARSARRGRSGAGPADPRSRGSPRPPTRSATAGGGWARWCATRSESARRSCRRLGRFERSHDLMRRRTTAGSGSLADVAAACGYADHAHLTREWAALAGCTPSTWQREEFPDRSSHRDAGREQGGSTHPTRRSSHDRRKHRPPLAHHDRPGRRRDDRVVAAPSASPSTRPTATRQDPSVVHHAEWLWPGGGGIMFGTQRPDERDCRASGRPPATSSPRTREAVFDAAVAAGATVERPMVDQDYGGHGRQRARPGGQPLVVRELPAVLRGVHGLHGSSPTPTRVAPWQ